MPRNIRVRPEAERDVETAFAWYEEQRAGLGRELLHELDVVYERINPTAPQKEPNHCPYHRGRRERHSRADA